MPHQTDDSYSSKHLLDLSVQSNREIENNNEAKEIITEILDIFNRIQRLQDFRPRPEVNDLFSRLVHLCIQPHSEALSQSILEDRNIKLITPKLRKLCSAAEGELETHWAQKILQSARESDEELLEVVHQESQLTPLTARDTLHAFPYYTNYLCLSRLETSALSSILPNDPHSIAFIGSGPLPLTSFCFADHYPNAQICNIDCEIDAIQLSSALANTLNYFKQMTFLCENAAHCTSLSDFDVVFLAALVGMNKSEKEVVLRRVVARMRKGAVLCVRSAHSLRGLLYPVVEFDEAMMDMGLRLEIVMHPWNHVVNSLMVFRVVDV